MATRARFVFCLFSAVWLLLSLSDPNLPSYEISALHELYNATNGADWDWGPVGSHWVFTPTANPCVGNWQGITCVLPLPEATYYVSVILLPSFNLMGTIPDSIGVFSQLNTLDLSTNNVNGTIPATVSNLTRLTTLDLHSNQLESTIPVALGLISDLTYMDLDSNQLQGTIPTALGSLSRLSYLDFYFNQLEGTIPAALGSLSHLTYLRLDANKLTGTIPEVLGSLSQLSVLELYSNQLEGTIPAALGLLSQLTALALDSNRLEGTIPAALGSLANLTFLGLDYNRLEGTIPETVVMLQHVTILWLQGNWLTGSLPAEIGNMTALQFLHANDNLLSGSLPSLKQLSALQELQLYNNSLSGPLSHKFANLSALTYTLLSNNRFSGPLDNAFNASLQTKLTTIQVNNNQLTGTIPEKIFKLPSLLNFVAVSNCFHGTVPPSACDALILNGLILDGLSSATSCRRTLPSGAYLLSRSVGGTLPICLFQLPNLTILHLSGNKFTGSIPGTVALSDTLYDVSLSHNSLTGAIPEVIQQRRWYNLDLSYNRLSATLSGDFGANHVAYPALQNVTENDFAVALENNRLSGRIPGFLQSLQNVSTLGTNLFSCALDGSDLPAQDDDRGNYQCGSSGFDVPYYVWLILAGVGCSGLAWTARVSSGAVFLRSCYDSSQRVVDDRPVLASFMHAMNAMFGANLYAGLFIVVLLVPCYATLSHYSGTLTHQYAWVVSAAFLSGAVPVAVELPLWLLLAVGMLVVLGRASLLADYSARGCSSWSKASTAASTSPIPNSRRYAIYATFLLIDVVVVVGVNVLYVYIAIYQSSALLVLAQVLMSFFKLFWNSVCMDAILRALVRHFAPQLLLGQGYAKVYRVRLMSLQVFTALLNSVVVPCLVVAAVSPSCFYNVFQPAPTVTSAFRYQACTLFTLSGECLIYSYTRSATSYEAPFTYSYQCSSSLITYYAPAFVNLCIITVFVVPAAQLAGLQLLQRLPSNCWCGYAHALLRQIVPQILRPLPADATDHDLASTVTYVQPSRVLVSLATSLGVLLTFGAVFPPLGLALALTAAVTVLLTKLTIGRFLCGAERRGLLSAYLGILELQCEGAGSAGFLRGTAWMLLTLSCLFYTLFLFDTLGDAVGFQGALWVLIAVPLLPALLYAVVAFAERTHLFRAADGEAGAKEEVEGAAATQDIELRMVATVSPVHYATDRT